MSTPKLITIALLLSLFFQPLSFAFAEESKNEIQQPVLVKYICDDSNCMGEITTQVTEDIIGVLPFVYNTEENTMLVNVAPNLNLEYSFQIFSKLNNTNDFITVTQATEPVTSYLINDDYDQAGAMTNPIEGVNTTDRQDITSVSVGTYLPFNLNQTGQSWISKTTPTKLALREGHDTKNIPFAGTANLYNRLNIRTSEYAGTSSDPILEVTYTMPTAITYKYDQAGNRVWTQNGLSNTYYPNKNYTYDGTTKTKDIYAGSTLIASTTTVGAIVTPYYVHTDHLNSTNVISDTTGTNMNLLDYFPYGSQRINSGSYSSARQYIGQKFDVDTSLNYLNARYYDGKRGQFVSEDSMFWKLPQELLIDPQQQNSYSYARDNPINRSDPTGNASNPIMAGIKSFLSSLFSGASSKSQTSTVNQNTSKGTNQKQVLNSPVGNAPITSSFMSDRSNCSVCSKTHGGTDYAVPIGTPVYATAPGKVIESRSMSGYGNTVIVNHGPSVQKSRDNVFTLYSHGSSLQVINGQDVKTNDLLMYSGDSGKTTGPHVHYEVVSNPSYPENFFHNLNIRYGPDELSRLLIKQ